MCPDSDRGVTILPCCRRVKAFSGKALPTNECSSTVIIQQQKVWSGRHKCQMAAHRWQMTRSLCLLVTVHTVRGARSWKQFGFLEDEDLSRWVAASQLPRKRDGDSPFPIPHSPLGNMTWSVQPISGGDMWKLSHNVSEVHEPWWNCQCVVAESGSPTDMNVTSQVGRGPLPDPQSNISLNVFQITRHSWWNTGEETFPYCGFRNHIFFFKTQTHFKQKYVGAIYYYNMVVSWTWE